MKLPTWQNIRELYESVVELPAPERALQLRQRAGGSDVLVREVERLLAHTDEERDYLAPPSDAVLAADVVQGSIPRAGERLGAYVLREAIGAGGMGTVFLARQERPSRDVALKVMRPGLAFADSVRRFELEAEVLGRLRHPGIAAIYEFGTWTVSASEGGSSAPFLAMEYIEGGRDIVSFAREGRLSVRERIGLFQEVCAAVAHAHANGVIHRDLKPGNVLIDAGGRAKVIDFGIARVTAPGLERAVATQAGQVFGTLQYASPEQISGDWCNVDVRTDVYALGALLFELLAGRPYFEAEGKSIAAVIRELCEVPPPPPSSFARGLARELDWIVLKCLRKDREARYGGVDALSADLSRFLRDEPVAVGPPSVSYRARKFVARNRVAVGAAALVLASIVGGLISTMRALGRARREHGRAEDSLLAQKELTATANDALRQQTGVVDVLKRILGAVTPGQDGRKVTLYELLERERPKLEREFLDDPHSRAAIQSILGAAYDGLGLRAEADELLTSAISTLEQFDKTDPLQLAWLRLMLAQIRTGQSRFAEARGLFDASLGLLESQGKLHSEVGIRGLRLHAQMLAREGQNAEARDGFRSVVQLSEEVLGPDHPDTIMAMSQVAKQSGALRRREDAEDWARRAQTRAESSVGPSHPLTLFTSIELGQALQARGKLTEAVPLLRGVLEGSIETYGERHPNTIHATQVLARALRDAAQFDEAQEFAQRALDTVIEHHPTVLDLEVWARLCVAEVLAARGDSSAAAKHLSAALERLDAANMPAHPAHFRLRWALAELDLATGRTEAIDALVQREQALGEPESRQLIVARSLRGRALWAQGRSGEAEAELKVCLDTVAAWRESELAALDKGVFDSLVDACSKLGRQELRKRLEALEQRETR